MATPRTVQLNEITVTAAKIIINCESGVIYDNIRLILGNPAAANGNAPVIATCIGLIDILMNGQSQRKADATNMASEAALFGANWAPQFYAAGTNGLPAGNGNGRTHLLLMFKEPRSRLHESSVDVASLGWKTKWLPKNKGLQIVIANTLGVGISISAEAEIRDGDDSDVNGPSSIVKMESYDNVLGANPSTLNNWSKNVPAGDRFVSLSIFNSSGGVGGIKTVDKAYVEAGGAKFIEDILKASLVTQLKSCDLDPVGADALANAYRVVFDRNETTNDSLPQFDASLLKVTMSAAANGEGLIILTQRYGFPNGYSA